MSVIVKANLEQVKEYKNKNVSTKVGNKKHQVYFKVEVDDFSLVEAIEHAKMDRNVLMLEYAGSDNYLKSVVLAPSDIFPYVGVSYEVGMNLSEDDITNALAEYPAWTTVIIKLPDEYKNLEFLHGMCQKYPRIRFCGGYTFSIDGCRLGCCGRDILEKKNIKVTDTDYLKDGCSCALQTLQFEDVELAVSAKAERSSNTSGTKSSAPKKAAKFSNLLGGATKVEF